MTMHALPLPYCPSNVAIAKPAKSKTILLVEDDDNLRCILRNVLIKKGYTVLDAGFNSSAFLMAGRYERPIDLMITDLMMPGTTGHDLATRLKAFRPDMKVLYISGQSKAFIDRNGLLDHDDAFLQKPFDINVLLDTARTIMAHSPRNLVDEVLPHVTASAKEMFQGMSSLVASVKSLLSLPRK